MDFKALIERVRKDNIFLPDRLLCLDPGHTTGWCMFEKGKITQWGQEITVVQRVGHNEGIIDWEAVHNLILKTKPTYIVCEDYRVYAHKLERHTNSQVLTVRIIGVIDFLSWYYKIPIHYQMASLAKGFCTDKKLKMWDFWKPGMRHSRDAIRHGCYFLLFNKEEQNDV